MGYVQRVQATASILSIALLLTLAPSAARADDDKQEDRDHKKNPDAALCGSALQFKRGDFEDSTHITNRWLPLIPGTQYILEGRANRSGTPLPHRVIFTVTEVTKVIDGVNTVVLWDQDINDGTLSEEELAFHAQDEEGNVWNLGEYPEEFEDGKFSGAPSTWISGVKDAVGGVAMPHEPKVGQPAYLQGSVPSIDFLDCGRAIKKNQTVKVPAGTYKRVLVIEETSPLDPEGGSQIKYHAPGVGIVQVGAVGDPEGETLVLVKLRHLGREELNQANRQALRLDKRGYRFVKLYRTTKPARLDDH